MLLQSNGPRQAISPSKIGVHEAGRARKTEGKHGWMPTECVALHVLRVFIVAPQQQGTEQYALENAPRQEQFGGNDWTAGGLIVATESNGGRRDRHQQLGHADIVPEHRRKGRVLAESRPDFGK